MEFFPSILIFFHFLWFCHKLQNFYDNHNFIWVGEKTTILSPQRSFINLPLGKRNRSLYLYPCTWNLSLRLLILFIRPWRKRGEHYGFSCGTSGSLSAIKTGCYGTCPYLRWSAVQLGAMRSYSMAACHNGPCNYDEIALWAVGAVFVALWSARAQLIEEAEDYGGLLSIQ